MKFQRQFLLFGLVGSLGFVVDSGVLYLLKDVAGLYMGRVYSFTSAVFVTWILNRNMTFADRTSGYSQVSEFVQYFLLMLLGGAVNYGAYVAMISHFSWAYDQPVWAVAAGSIAGLGVNLVTSKFVLYRHRRT